MNALVEKIIAALQKSDASTARGAKIVVNRALKGQRKGPKRKLSALQKAALAKGRAKALARAGKRKGKRR